MRGIDYYELLGVAQDASSEEIRSAYRALAKAMHPDAGGTAGAFRLLREAYETLADPDRRAEYDSGDTADDETDWAVDGADDTDRAHGGARGGTGGRGGETDWPGGETDWPGSEADWAGRRAGGGGGADRAGGTGGAAGASTSWRDSGKRSRRFRADEGYEPVLPVLDPETIPWWQDVRKERRVTLAPRTGPTQGVAVGVAGGVAGLVLLLAVVGAPGWLVILVLLAGGAGAVEVGRRHVAAQRIEREFSTEFGDRVVFGRPGQEDDEVAERLTAELLSLYLTRIPGVRICHGLAAEEGSVFADLDHAVLCGRRLVLIESKLWLPGHYEVDDDGEILRNGHRFRGGVVRLPERLAYYRALLPDVELRGVLLIYPSRAGKITVGDGIAHTPERFVRDIGGWFATEPSTVDHTVFRALLRQVTSTT